MGLDLKIALEIMPSQIPDCLVRILWTIPFNPRDLIPGLSVS